MRPSRQDLLEHLYRVSERMNAFAFSRYEWLTFHEYYLDWTRTLAALRAELDALTPGEEQG